MVSTTRLGVFGRGRHATWIPSQCMTRQGRLCISSQRGNQNSADTPDRSRRIWVRWQTLSQSDAPARKRSALCRTRPSVRLDKTSWRQAEPSGLNEPHLSNQEVPSQFIISHVSRNPSVQSSSRSMQSDLAFRAARTPHSGARPTPAPDVGVTPPASAWRATRKKLDSFAVYVPFSCCVLFCGQRSRRHAGTPRRLWRYIGGAHGHGKSPNILGETVIDFVASLVAAVL